MKREPEPKIALRQADGLSEQELNQRLDKAFDILFDLVAKIGPENIEKQSTNFDSLN